MPQGLLPKLDISDLQDNGSCYTIGTNAIYVYTNNNRTRTEYHIFNNKVTKYYTQNYNYNYDINGYHCYSYNDISNLPTQVDWIAPVYYCMAVCIALFLLYIPYKIFVYPWWRRV